jgi:selenocysteine-specific elongation factor
MTKTDLVDAARLAIVRDEIGTFVAGTFLQDAPLVEVSAASGDGIDTVLSGIAALARRAGPRSEKGSFFMPLDRVFTMRGFGLVVTGTLRGGRIAVGDKVQIMPADQVATIRGLQNHNQPVQSVVPGQRVAVNLRNVERDDVKRGDVLAAPDTVEPARRSCWTTRQTRFVTVSLSGF